MDISLLPEEFWYQFDCCSGAEDVYALFEAYGYSRDYVDALLIEYGISAADLDALCAGGGEFNQYDLTGGCNKGQTFFNTDPAGLYECRHCQKTGHLKAQNKFQKPGQEYKYVIEYYCKSCGMTSYHVYNTKSDTKYWATSYDLI